MKKYEGSLKSMENDSFVLGVIIVTVLYVIVMTILGILFARAIKKLSKELKNCGKPKKPQKIRRKDDPPSAF